MDEAHDPPATSPPDVDVMDVSPALHTDAVSPTPLEDKENDDRVPQARLHPPTRPHPSIRQDPPLRPEAPTDAPPLHSVSGPDTGATDGLPPAQHGPQLNPAAAAALSPVQENDNRDTDFAFALRKYDSIQQNKVYSPWHHFGGFRWRLLIFPKGNQSSSHELSVYLECGGPSNRVEFGPHAQQHGFSANGKEAAVATMAPLTWSRPAKFSLHLVHPSSPVAIKCLSMADDQDHYLSDLDVSDSNTGANVSMTPAGRGGGVVGGVITAVQRQDVVKETSHIFRENASDWGFLEFASFNMLQPMQYADEDMNVVIMVRIRLQDSLENAMFNNAANWDSRKHTGFVGFKNQGATCYMNSLLQTLYMVNAFRKAVYNMPLPEPGNENSGSELSYALQKVFYELQFSPTVVKTKKLTESFGWDTTDAFTQHDVQELKLILCDELAEKMKKIAPDKPNTLATLFQGKLLNYLECVNVDYKSTREELFTDLSVNVRGCRNVYESFEKYTEVEMMEGENKYRADGHEELQDAKKGVKFLKLPPVLQLHLKRFEYDTARYAMVKINDRYEFESEMDLSRYVEDSDGSDIYLLHSVLVHIGDVNGGHYHVFIRPEITIPEGQPKKPDHWYKFDDEVVIEATEEAAIQDNFGFGGDRDVPGKRGPGIDDDLGNGGINGGQPPPSVFQSRNRNYQTRRFSNAYMLQYLRKSDVPYLLKAQDPSDVPKELAARITKELEEEEQRKRDIKEQHLYMNIAVAVDSDMVAHHLSDLVQWDHVRQLRVKRALQLGELKHRLQKEGLVRDARRMRLWKCSGRQNDTIRPDSLVANGSDSLPITDPNARDPLTQASYNVALYTGRHAYFGQEEIVRMYAEDFCSPYCLGAGQAYSEYVDRVGEWNGGRHSISDMRDENQHTSEMETDSVRPVSSSRSSNFQLAYGREVLLFVKYYTPSPVPRLQWLGHFVVDRSSHVRDLHPQLRQALELFRKRDATQPGLDPGTEICVFEEVSANSVPPLSGNKSLEDQRIPFESGSGDILVFQQKGRLRAKDNDFSDGMVSDEYDWDGYQEPSRGDGTDLPLGGRPLPTVNQFFDYLAYRIKIQFKDKSSVGGPNEVRSVFFILLRKDSYYTARKVLAGYLGDGVDPDYLRFFAHDLTREIAAQQPLLLGPNEELQRVLPMHNLVTTAGEPEHRILWYERTEYHISEFDSKDEVRVVWRQDGGARATPYSGSGGTTYEVGVTADNIIRAEVTVSVTGDDYRTTGYGSETPNGQLSSHSGTGDQAKSFSVLVPMASKYADVMDQVRIKLKLPSDTKIRMFEVKNSKIFRFINPNDPVSPLMTGTHDCGAELRAEPVPEDETEEALGAEYELMTVLHLSKDKQPRQWRGLTFFGVPFVIKVRKEGETVKAIRKRIQEKLGVPQEQFNQWPLAEVVQLKVLYLDQGDVLYYPHARVPLEFCSLAIEHKSTAPAKKTTSAMSRYADKPLKIRS